MLHRLVLMRHAKSTPASFLESDHTRPLEQRGTHDAHQIGLELKKRNIKPELVLCSDAKRTKDTWEQVAKSLHSDTPFKESSELYESGLSSYLDSIVRAGKGAKCLMVIGHNPTTEILITRLSGKDVEIKPAFAAILEIEATNWSDALGKKGLWELVDLLKC